MISRENSETQISPETEKIEPAKTLEGTYRKHFRDLLLEIVTSSGAEAQIARATAEVSSEASNKALGDVDPTFRVVLYYLKEGKPREVALSVTRYFAHESFLISHSVILRQGDQVVFQTTAENFEVLRDRISQAREASTFKL